MPLCSERPLSDDEQVELEERLDRLTHGHRWTRAEARRELPGCLLFPSTLAAVAGVLVALVVFHGAGRPIHEEVSLTGLAAAGLGLVVGLIAWGYAWKNSARSDLRMLNRFGGEEEGRRIRRQLSRGTVQRIAGEVAAAAWWENPEDHGTACVLDLGTDRLFLIVDLVEDTMPRQAPPSREVEIEFFEETRELASIRFVGPAIATHDFPLEDFPAPPDPDRHMLTTWFLGDFGTWVVDLNRALA